jgi:pyrroloquinoline-quinone synthase
MDATAWFERVKTELLAHNPYVQSEYFKRFGAGTLTREQAWAHLAQNYLLVCYFPRIFSGIHARCDELEVRKECAKHLLVEDLGYFRGKIGETPDHVELFKRIGDDFAVPRDAYDRIRPLPETAAILDFFRRLAHDIPWSAALCATAFMEAEVGQMSELVGHALMAHYGCRPEWGGMNYIVHEEAEREEAGDTEKAILQHLRTREDVAAAEQAMRELNVLLDRYARAVLREYVPG